MRLIADISISILQSEGMDIYRVFKVHLEKKGQIFDYLQYDCYFYYYLNLQKENTNFFPV